MMTGESLYFAWEEGEESCYLYDKADRLIKHSLGKDTYEYNYDRRGNLTAVRKNGQPFAAYEYDRKGSCIRKETEGRIICYTYNPLGYRIGRSITEEGRTVRHTYRHDWTVRTHTLREIHKDGKTIALSYGWAPNDPYLRTKEEEKTYFHLTDQNRTPLLTITEEGRIVCSYHYDAFGKKRETGSSGSISGNKEGPFLPIGYAGYEEDGDGTYLAGCRYYAPEIGRFLSPDRLGGGVNDIQGQNAYAYVRNNPLTYTDPDGLRPAESRVSGYLTGNLPAPARNPNTAALQGNGGRLTTGTGNCLGEKGDLERGLEQMLLGNQADGLPLLGTAASLLLGMPGLKPYASVRDILSNLFFGNRQLGRGLYDIRGLWPKLGNVKYKYPFSMLSTQNLYNNYSNYFYTNEIKVNGLKKIDDYYANYEKEDEFRTSEALKIKNLAEKWNINYNSVKWKNTDVIYWQLIGKNEFLHEKKTKFVEQYKDVIKDAAREYNLPEILIAGVVYNEYGGDPMLIDDIAYRMRSFDWSGPDWVDENLTITKNPDLTSFGNVSIQVRRAEETLNYKEDQITNEVKEDVIKSMKDPVENIYISAKHLSDLRDGQYQGKNSDELTENEIIIIATRYNRGPDLSLETIENDTSYGNAIINKIDVLEGALNGEK